VLEQAAMRSDSSRIEVPQLEAVLRESGVQRIELASPMGGAGQTSEHSSEAEVASRDAGGLLRPLSVQVEELERQAIQAAMEASRGNKVAAAKMLGIARATLYARLENA
jgi:DNA-binding NtrC family response regulator